MELLSYGMSRRQLRGRLQPVGFCQVASTRKVNLLVVTRAEIVSLQSAEHFAALVRDKIMAHSLGAPFF